MDQRLVYNEEAERGVLGSCLLLESAAFQASSELTEEYFLKKEHKIIFSIIRKVVDCGSIPDTVTIVDEASKEGTLEDIGGVSFLASLTSCVPRSNVGQYIGILSDKKRTKDAYNAFSEAQGFVENGDTEAGIALVSSLLMDDGDQKKDITKVCDSVFNVADYIKGVSGGEIQEKAIKTGISSIDKLIFGLQEDDLAILAARPSMGKTTLAMNIAFNAAEQGKKVLVFSVEMSKEKLLKNQLSSYSGISMTAIHRGTVFRESFNKIDEAAKHIGTLPVFIDETSAPHIRQIQAKAKTLSIKLKGIDLIVVDYLQLCRGDNQNKTIEVGEISSGLKALAKDLHVPVLALSQLSRKCEERSDKRPMLSDLRDSGAIEQDADLIMFLYRDKYYNPDTALGDITELICAKARVGETGKARILFDGQFSKFVGVENDEVLL